MSSEQVKIKVRVYENFLIVNNNKHHIVIFATEENIAYMKECDRILIMGEIFATAPTSFYQLFRVHGVAQGNYNALLFCLLPDMMENSYEEALRLTGKLLSEKNVCRL